jgi:hypothetical protein
VSKTGNAGLYQGTPYLVRVIEQQNGTNCDFLGSDMQGQMEAWSAGDLEDDPFVHWSHELCMAKPVDTSAWTCADGASGAWLDQIWLSRSHLTAGLEGDTDRLRGVVVLNFWGMGTLWQTVDLVRKTP